MDPRLTWCNNEFDEAYNKTRNIEVPKRTDPTKEGKRKMLHWCSCTLVCKTGKPKLATPKGHFMHQKCQKNPKNFFSRLFDYFITCLLIKFKTDLKVTPLNNLGQGFDSPFHQKIKFNDQLYSTPFSWLLKSDEWWQ